MSDTPYSDALREALNQSPIYETFPKDFKVVTGKNISYVGGFSNIDGTGAESQLELIKEKMLKALDYVGEDEDAIILCWGGSGNLSVVQGTDSGSPTVSVNFNTGEPTAPSGTGPTTYENWSPGYPEWPGDHNILELSPINTPIGDALKLPDGNEAYGEFSIDNSLNGDGKITLDGNQPVVADWMIYEDAEFHDIKFHWEQDDVDVSTFMTFRVMVQRRNLEILWEGPLTVQENAEDATPIGGPLRLGDMEIEPDGTWELSDNASGKFALVEKQIETNGEFDYTVASEHTIEVKWTHDESGHFVTQTFRVAVIPTNFEFTEIERNVEVIRVENPTNPEMWVDVERILDITFRDDNRNTEYKFILNHDG